VLKYHFFGLATIRTYGSQASFTLMLLSKGSIYRFQSIRELTRTQLTSLGFLSFELVRLELLGLSHLESIIINGSISIICMVPKRYTLIHSLNTRAYLLKSKLSDT
jgi:hypothetical protein